MFLLWLAIFTVEVSGFINPYPKLQTIRFGPDAGEKLILTPYIEAGKLDVARNLSKVRPLKGNVTSYSGFVTVDKECDSNMFFWFFPAVKKPETAPISVWLQGGPGASSLYGLFDENGPFDLTDAGNLKLRKYSWTFASSYLYIDNPVGTGFSYASREDCYSRNETHVGQNLLSAVKQVLQLFPELSQNPFFVTGESYAGKYVPALAYAIHKDNQQQGSGKVNLQGIAIGNGLVDPENQLHYGDYLYQLGLIDSDAREHFHQQEDLARQYIAQKKWHDAFQVFDSLLNGDKIPYPSYFRNQTGFSFYFNYLHCDQPAEGDVDGYVRKLEFRQAVHVGDAAWHGGSDVEYQLEDDMMQSVRPWLEELLENYRVLIYNGQLDIIVAYPLTLGYLQKLNWSGAEAYKTATRQQWRVGSELAGYVKIAGNLTEVLVRSAGHMVPADQPRWALDLISRFVRNKPFVAH